MKKQLIGTLVAALILFIWQFLSWGLINLHAGEQNYTEHQDKILAVMAENQLQEGQYLIPTVPPGTPMEKEGAFREQLMGKPWALINYHPRFELSMPMNMTRGLVIDLLAAFFLCWILGNYRELNPGKGVMTAMAIGAIGYLTTTYLYHIWFGGSTSGYLLDATVPWALVGAFLGWYLPTRNK